MLAGGSAAVGCHLVGGCCGKGLEAAAATTVLAYVGGGQALPCPLGPSDHLGIGHELDVRIEGNIIGQRAGGGGRLYWGRGARTFREAIAGGIIVGIPTGGYQTVEGFYRSVERSIIIRIRGAERPWWVSLDWFELLRQWNCWFAHRNLYSLNSRKRRWRWFI